MVVDDLGHDPGALDEGHHNDPGLLGIQKRRVLEFALAKYGKRLFIAERLHDFVPGVFHPAHIGIGFQRIKGAAFVELLHRMAGAHNYLVSLAVLAQKILQAAEVFPAKGGGRQVVEVGHIEVPLHEGVQ